MAFNLPDDARFIRAVAAARARGGARRFGPDWYSWGRHIYSDPEEFRAVFQGISEASAATTARRVVTNRLPSTDRRPLLGPPSPPGLSQFGRVTHTSVGRRQGELRPLGNLVYNEMRGGQSQVFGDRPVDDIASDVGETLGGYDRFFGARSAAVDERDFLRRMGLAPEVGPIDRSRLYRYYQASSLQVRQEIGGYSVPGGAAPGMPMFEDAINAEVEEAAEAVNRIRSRLHAFQSGARQAEGWRASNAIWENRIRPLEQDLSAAQNRYYRALGQQRIFHGDRTAVREAGGVRRSIIGAVDTSMSEELQGRMAEIRQEAVAEFGYPTMRVTPEALRVGEERAEAYLREQLGTDFFPAAEKELLRSERLTKNLAEQAAETQRGLTRGIDFMYELFATGALPSPTGGVGSAIPLPSGPLAGHQVNILEALNPNNIRIGRGGVIENLPTGMEGSPGIGFRYRPVSAPVEEHMMAQIGFTELERSTPPAPLLQAFQTTATSPLLLEDAKDARKQFLRWAGLEDEVGTEAGRRTLQKAIGEVDRQYSQRIYGRMLGNAPTEEARAAYTTATRLDALTGRVGDKTMRQVFTRLLGEGEGEITPVRAAAEIVAGTLFTPMGKVGETAADRLMQAPGERAASETIDKLGALGHSETGWTTERYGDALIQLLGNQNDPFARQVREILNVNVPGMRDLEWKGGVHKRFRSLIERSAEESFGVRAAPSRRGRMGAREAEVKREIGRDRARQFADPRLQVEVSFSNLMETTEEGEEVPSQALLRAEQRVFNQSDLQRPEDVLEYLGQRRFLRAQEVREDVTRLADLRVRQNQLKLLQDSSRDVRDVQRYSNAYRQVSNEYEQAWAAIHGKGVEYAAEFEKIWTRTVPTIVKARSVINPAEEIDRLRGRIRLREPILRGESPGFTEADLARYTREVASARERVRLLERFNRPILGPEDVPVSTVRKAQFTKAERRRLLETGGTQEYQRLREIGALLEEEENPLRRTLLIQERRRLLSDVEPGLQSQVERAWSAYTMPAGVPRNVMMSEIGAIQERTRVADLRNNADAIASKAADKIAGRLEEGVFVPSGMQDTFYSALQNMHGWDDYTTGQLRSILQGEKHDPFFGSEPETVLESLEAMREEGTHLAMSMPGFAENYRRITGAPSGQALENLHVQIQDLYKLGDETEALTARNIALRLNVLGTGSTAAGREVENRVAVQAALNLPRYEAALAGTPAFRTTSPLSAKGRQEIMRMARAELDASGGVPQMTWQMRYRPHGVAPTSERLASYEMSREARIGHLVSGGATTSEAYDWNAVAERSDLTGFGRYEAIPNSELLDVVQPAQYMHIRAADIARFTGPNTVTAERNTVNRAIAERAVLFRRPGGLFGKKRVAQIHAMQITNPEVAPLNPVTGERLTDFYSPIVADIDKELREQGLSWDLVTGISSGFERIKGTPGIDLSERSKLSQAVRLRARKTLGMMEPGERGARFGEQYFYAPLAAGRFVHPGTGDIESAPRMYDMFARALWQKDMPLDEIRHYAQAFGFDNANIADRGELIEHIARQGYDLRSEPITKMIAQSLGEQTRALMQPEIVRDVLSQDQYRPVAEAIWQHAVSKIAPFTETGRVQAAGHVAGQAERHTESILRSDIYKRINFAEISRLWKENRVFRGGAIAAGALATIGVASSFRKKKDHTPDDVRGPRNMPGGGPYDRVPPARGFSSSGYNYQNQPPQQGVTYYVNARGGHDPRAFQAQVGGVAGGPVSGTIYDTSPAYDPTRRANKVMDSYG